MPALAMQPIALSEIGRRGNNEDAVFVSPRLVAVADGVGGQTSGEVASQLAIQKMIGLDKRRLVSSLEQEFAATVADANEVIRFATDHDPGYSGMATTLTAVALSNDGMFLVANVGDSRTYLLRGGELRQLTRDDSLVQEMIDQGMISAESARSHPQRNIVLAALDGAERTPPVLQSVKAALGDRLLLCSDGVSDYLTDAEITDLLKNPNAAIAVRQLIQGALDHDSRDNVTAVVADIIIGGGEADGWLDALPAAPAPSD